MPLAQVLQEFKTSVAQCDNLVVNAHKADANGVPVLPAIDQQQITTAAFLNMFIAWEGFLESSLMDLMLGATTTNGKAPTKYVAPPDIKAAQGILKGILSYFDFAKHDNVIRMVKLYFKDGYPYEPHLSSINSDLSDLRAMRNACAHISSTTQTSLEALALRIFGKPQTGITVYRMLTAIVPKSGGNTVFVTYRSKLLVTAELIAIG